MVVKYSLNLSDQIVMMFCFDVIPILGFGSDVKVDDVCHAVYIDNFGFSYDATTNREKEEVREYLDSKGLKYGS